MAMYATLHPHPISCAAPPSPARDICFVFCAFADPGSDRAATGRKGHKQRQKNCANLCTIVHSNPLILFHLLQHVTFRH